MNYLKRNLYNFNLVYFKKLLKNNRNINMYNCAEIITDRWVFNLDILQTQNNNTRVYLFYQFVVAVQYNFGFFMDVCYTPNSFCRTRFPYYAQIIYFTANSEYVIIYFVRLKIYGSPVRTFLLFSSAKSVA